MSKNIKGAIPKWRFLEFRDSGEWEEKELNESLNYLQPTQYLVQSENYSNNYETPVLTAGKSFVLGYTNEKDGIFNNKLPVIIFDDFTTDSKFVDFPFKVKSSAIKILLAKYNFNIKFIFEIMQMVSYEVSVHKRHWISIFSKLKVLTPKLPEQQKIADCLSSIDDLIFAEEKKLSLLNDYKKGWVQKLFPAEGKTIPEWRFPEFILGDSIDYVEGRLMFDAMTNRNHNADLPILAITQEYGAIPRDKIDYTVFVTEKSLASYKVVEKGDFIISLRSFQGGIEYSMYDGICSPAYIILRKKINIIDQYYKYYFKSHRFIQDLNKNLEGIRDGKMVSYSQFSSILLPKPDRKEQQKIANFLSSIDDLINKQKDRIEALKQHKKALMQGLFPAAEEVLK